MKTALKARLTEGSIPKILVNLTIPMIFGMLGMVLFNLTDTFFVGKLGTEQLAALSFTYPVVLIINSLALGLGLGASAVISTAIGEGNIHKVKRLTTDSLLLGLAIVLIFVIGGILTLRTLFSALGAEGLVLEYIRQYMVIWYIGMMFVVVPMIGNNAIRATGDTKTPSLIMMAAAGLNIILDPLLIFGLGPFPKMGIQGAALATVFARFTSFSLAMLVLAKREKMLLFKVDSIIEIWQSWKSILYIGIPITASRMIVPFTTGIITRLLAQFGTFSVAGFGVASRLEYFSLAVVMALSSVIGPFIGQNLGAQKIDRVLKGISLSSIFAMIWGLFLLVVLIFFSSDIAGIFSRDKSVISIIVLYMSIVPISYGLNGIFQLCTTALNVIRKPYHSTGLIFVQMFVIYIPAAHLGVRLWQERGIFISTALAYILGGIFSYLVLKKQLKLKFGSLE